MFGEILGSVDRQLRAIAYGILGRRDGVSNWEQKRDEFIAGVEKSSEELKIEVETKLRKLLVHARETSPYYRNLWYQHGLATSLNIATSDFQQIPYLTKDIIRDHAKEMISEKFNKESLDEDLTSGTTRARTPFYRNHECTVSRVGRQWGILGLCGYKPGMRRALVWGVHSDLLQSNSRKNLKQWFREYATSQVALGCKVMNEQDMYGFHQRLQKYRPDILYGYSTAMVRFGRYIQDMKLSPIRVKKIFTTAERLTSRDRMFLQEAFAGEVFNLYCTREYGCIGFECNEHKGFHIDNGSVYLEIIKNGEPVNVNNGETGEIVITDLLNYGMPIIRSRTGDIGSLSITPCECGLSLPLLKSLDGRVFDNIYRPDGSVVAGVLLSYLFLDIPAIKAVQYVQENIHDLSVLMEVTGNFTGDMEIEAMRQLQERMGNDMNIAIHCVKEIPRNPLSGKYQEVISKIPMQ